MGRRARLSIFLLAMVTLLITGSTLGGELGTDYPPRGFAPQTSGNPEAVVPGAQGNLTVGPGSWPAFEGGGGLNGTSPGPGPSNNSTSWKVYVGAGAASPPQGAADSAVISRGIVYATTGAGQSLIALNESSGSLLWTVSLPLPSQVSPVLVGGRVVVAMGSANGSVGALAAWNASTGSLDWTATPSPSGALTTAPNVVDGLVVVGGASGHIYVYSASTGLLVERTDLSGTPVQTVALGPPSLPLALVSTNEGGHGVLDGFNVTSGGNLSWTPFPLSNPVEAAPLETTYSWRPGPGPGGATVALPLALLGDDGGNASPLSYVYAFLTTPENVNGVSLPPGLLVRWNGTSGSGGFASGAVPLGQVGTNLSFGLVATNGSFDIFHLDVSGSGTPTLNLYQSIRVGPSWSPNDPTPAPVVASGAIEVPAADGIVVSLSRSNLTVLWRAQLGAAVLATPSVASGALFVLDAKGVLSALGGPLAFPPAVRLLLSVSSAQWVVSGGILPFTLSADVLEPNGLLAPAANGTASVFASKGNVSGSPATLSAQGRASFNLSAPTVTGSTNISVISTVVWQGMANSTTFVVVALPANETHSTPLTVEPLGFLPTSMAPDESIPLSFLVAAGTSGGPVPEVAVTFQAFGGTVSRTATETNASGIANTTFTSERSSTLAAAGVTVSAEALGYPSGSYTWRVTVAAVPLLVPAVSPPALLLVAGSQEIFQIEVNSSSGGPVPFAVVNLEDPSVGGSLSVLGALTNSSGRVLLSYRAPGSVPAPGVASGIPVTISASGFLSDSFDIPLTVVPNSSGSPNANGSGGLSMGLIPGLPGWTDGVIVGILTIVIGVLLFRLWRPRRPRPPVPVWEEASTSPEPGGGSPPGAPGGAEDPALIPWRGPPDPPDP